MIAIGVIYGALTGNIEAVANGALESAGEAVQLCITMAVSYTHLTLPTKA